MKPPIKSRPTAEPPIAMIGEAWAMRNQEDFARVITGL
jgi:hypothetical protein